MTTLSLSPLTRLAMLDSIPPEERGLRWAEARAALVEESRNLAPPKNCTHCNFGRHVLEGRCDCQGRDLFAHLPRGTRVTVGGRTGVVEEAIGAPDEIRIGIWYDDAIAGSGLVYVRSSDLDLPEEAA